MIQTIFTGRLLGGQLCIPHSSVGGTTYISLGRVNRRRSQSTF